VVEFAVSHTNIATTATPKSANAAIAVNHTGIRNGLRRFMTL